MFHQFFALFVAPFIQKVVAGAFVALSFLGAANFGTGLESLHGVAAPTNTPATAAPADVRSHTQADAVESGEGENKDVVVTIATPETATNAPVTAEPPPIQEQEAATRAAATQGASFSALNATVPGNAERIIPVRELNEKARQAVVNIFCVSKGGGVFEPLSGSGVFIDQRGVIITNAHIAQYMLLRDYNVPDFIECVIRQGSPAVPLYKTEILYVPTAWVENNAQNVIIDKPTGTGENDFALLLVTDTVSPAVPFPEKFPFLPPAPFEEKPVRGNDVFVAGYPAGFLGGLDITKNLWLVSSTATIGQLLTFKDTPPYTADEFSVGGTILAQQGSSGGAVVNPADGNLIGIFVTSILEGTTAERDLRALSLSHVNESMKKYTGKNLNEFLSGDIALYAADFNETVAPRLTETLSGTLDKAAQ